MNYINFCLGICAKATPINTAYGNEVKNDHTMIKQTVRSEIVHTGSIGKKSNMVLLGDVFPNFTAQTSEGEMDFHNYIEDSWAILFSHPADFTPVCTTELGRAAKLFPEFAKRGVKMVGLSCDNVQNHIDWIKDIKAYSGLDEFPYPIVDDSSRQLAKKLGMIDPDEVDTLGMALTARAVFVIGKDKKLKLSILYPATTGRNFDEILRVIDSLQLTQKFKVATPVDWQKNGDVMITPSVKPEDVDSLFPKGYKTVEVPSGKKYIRLTQQPE